MAEPRFKPKSDLLSLHNASPLSHGKVYSKFSKAFYMLRGWVEKAFQSHCSLWLRCANTKSSCMNLGQDDLCLFHSHTPPGVCPLKNLVNAKTEKAKVTGDQPHWGPTSQTGPEAAAEVPWTNKTKCGQGAVTSAISKWPARGSPDLTTTLRILNLVKLAGRRHNDWDDIFH